MKKMFYIILLGLLCWMGIIFSFSAQPVEESVGLSMRITEKVADTVIPGYRKMAPKEQEKLLDHMNLAVRKGAHFTEYLILGILWERVLSVIWPMRRKWQIMAALAACVVFAAGDEFHQVFSAGRSPRIFDVCIDAAGAAVGIFLLHLLRKNRENRRRNKKM